MRLLRFLAAAVLWIVVILCLAITIVPRFLDALYYRGTPSAHFDGKRFANPDGDDTFAPATRPGGSVQRSSVGRPESPAFFQ